MKPYTLASERAAAPTGCAYIAPSLVDLWFRWGKVRPSGLLMTGMEVPEYRDTPVQVFDNGEWHQVIAFSFEDKFISFVHKIFQNRIAAHKFPENL